MGVIGNLRFRWLLAVERLRAWLYRPPPPVVCKPGDTYLGDFGTFLVPPDGPFTGREIDALMRERWLAGE